GSCGPGRISSSPITPSTSGGCRGSSGRNKLMPYPQFDRSRLRVQPLAARRHDLTLADLLPIDAPPSQFEHPAIPILAERLVLARSGANTGRLRNPARPAAILIMGAHVLRAGVQHCLIDLLERGLID